MRKQATNMKQATNTMEHFIQTSSAYGRNDTGNWMKRDDISEKEIRVLMYVNPFTAWSDTSPAVTFFCRFHKFSSDFEINHDPSFLFTKIFIFKITSPLVINCRIVFIRIIAKKINIFKSI